MPLCELLEQHARAVARLPAGSVPMELLHSLSLLALSLTRAARLGQPPTLAEEKACMANQRRRERLLSDAEILTLLSAVAAILPACTAQLPAALRTWLLLCRNAEQAAPAADAAALAPDMRPALQVFLLAPCRAALGLLLHLVRFPEAPHVVALWRRALSPQTFAGFLAAALDAAVVVHRETGARRAWRGGS